MIYTKDKSSAIRFPLGGIGAGCISVAGNGALVDWEIFNKANKGSFNSLSHFAIRAEKDGVVEDIRILNGDVPTPYIGNTTEIAGCHGFGWGPNPETLPNWPHFREHEFKGEFPFAEISFGGEKFPATPKLTAWSVFIPGNDRDSSLPAAMFEIELTNNSDSPCDYTIVGVMANPWYKKTPSYNKLDKNQLTCYSGDQTGDVSLTLLDDLENISGQEYFYRGDWWDPQETYFNDLMAGGRFKNRQYPEKKSISWINDHGLLATHFTLQPNETISKTFVITWSIPWCTNDWRSDIEELAKVNNVHNRWKNYYATQWENSIDSANYIATEYNRLYNDTQKFRNAVYNTSLPEETIESVVATLSVLKSPTCLRVEDGTFYGWEGIGSHWGSCEGSCTHVWNYAQALPFLFPALERSMRESHFKYSVDNVGGVHFRVILPLGIKATEEMFRPCVDGQFGDVMKFFRDWKISGDNNWLKEWYPTVKKILEYSWSKDNYDLWDPEQTGVIYGRQHHTLDAELFGPNGWLTNFYLGALLAMSQMADAVEDFDFATTCRELFAKGKKFAAEKLFNGEYFIQLVDLKDKDILTPYLNTNNVSCFKAIEDYYWNEEIGELKYQTSNGCTIDANTAQWFTKLYGIGDIIDSDINRKTLESIFKYNYKDNMREFCNIWRIFSLNDESGVIMCSFPHGKPAIPIQYNTETMHGFEWTLACHLISEGMLEEGKKIIDSIRFRYDGVRRNPYNEMECGSNYARNMASFGLLMAYSGFQFDNTSGMLGFDFKDPKEYNNTFWSLGSVWGNYAEEKNSAQLTVEYGSLNLSELRLSKEIKEIKLNEVVIPFEIVENRCMLNTINININDKLEIKFS